MLNRHIIRIKAMQALFAYEQHKNANRTWAIDQIDTPENFFSETQRKLTDQEKKEIKKILTKNPDKETIKAIADPKIRMTSQKALHFYHQQNKKNLAFLKKELITEISKINHWYYSILGLLLTFANIGKSYKRVNHASFFNNAFIVALGSNARVQKLLAKDSIDWNKEKSQTLSWFRTMISANPLYQQYIKSSDHDLESQKKMIKHIVRKLILKGVIDEYFLTKDIRWFENQRIVRIMLEKTIKQFNARSNTIHMPKLSLDWKTDREFMTILFEKTLNIDAEKRKTIAQNTRNWEIDRIPQIDRIILEMAVTEAIHCPEIPVKVTINEYIEIAKQYSTDNSPQFVNGILDTLVAILHKNGEIIKSGRGLIDNK